MLPGSAAIAQPEPPPSGPLRGPLVKYVLGERCTVFLKSDPLRNA